MLRDVLAEARANHESSSRDTAKQIRELESHRDKLQVESDGSALQVTQLQAKLGKQEAALEEFQVELKVSGPCRVTTLPILTSRIQRTAPCCISEDIVFIAEPVVKPADPRLPCTQRQQPRVLSAPSACCPICICGPWYTDRMGCYEPNL